MKWQVPFALATAGLLFALFAAWAYDDPFITFRYADNLRRGLGFVYNPGARVLSTTTPLFALLLAGLSFLWADLPRLANLLGALSLAAGALCLWDLGRAWDAPWAGWAALLLYPTFSLLLITLGSEMPVYLALCLGAFAAYARRRYAWAALWAALATLARGDGALVAALLAAHWALTARRGGASFPWRALALFGAPLLAWALFATAYFGSPLPVTLAAKQQQGAMEISQRFGPGLFTILRPYAGRWEAWLALGLAVLGMEWTARAARRWALFLAWPFVYFAAYTALGVSRYPWYYAPLAPGFVAAAGLGLEALRRALPPRAGALPWRVPLGAALAGGVLAALALAQGWRAANLAGRRDNRVAIYRAAGEWLNANTPPDATVGALEVGVMGYYSRRPMVDFAGLIQPEIARQLAPQATYEDAARWAIQTYQPDYLVLNPAQFPALAEAQVAAGCREAQVFEGQPFAYPGRLIIYGCAHKTGEN